MARRRTSRGAKSRSSRGVMLSLSMALAALGLGGVVMTTQAGAFPAETTATAGHGAHHQAPPKDAAAGDDKDGDGYIPADPPVTGVEPSTEIPPHSYHREFQAKCAVDHTGDDDPIVFPGMPGASHNHSFMGNTSTDADSTPESLTKEGDSTCMAPDDRSGYWMPTMFDGDKEIRPVGPQTIYYKAGVTDYRSVRPFPEGLRFLVGDPMQSADDFRNHPGFVEGWECGDEFFQTELPESCPTGEDVQVNIRFQAPSCWDGTYLDTPDHKSHMAYPEVYDKNGNYNKCPDDHPVALPMIEFKMAFPANGDTSNLRLASGEGHSFHYDFMNAWDQPTLKALVEGCINTGLQCNEQGLDIYHPEIPPVLGDDYRLPDKSG